MPGSESPKPRKAKNLTDAVPIRDDARKRRWDKIKSSVDELTDEVIALSPSSIQPLLRAISLAGSGLLHCHSDADRAIEAARRQGSKGDKAALALARIADFRKLVTEGGHSAADPFHGLVGEDMRTYALVSSALTAINLGRVARWSGYGDPLGSWQTLCHACQAVGTMHGLWIGNNAARADFPSEFKRWLSKQNSAKGLLSAQARFDQDKKAKALQMISDHDSNLARYRSHAALYRAIVDQGLCADVDVARKWHKPRKSAQRKVQSPDKREG